MTAEDRLLENEYEDVVIFKDASYDDALIGVSSDNRAIYDYDMMVEWLIKNDGMTYEEAMEWIDYNTLNSGDRCPIIMFRLEEFDGNKK